MEWVSSYKVWVAAVCVALGTPPATAAGLLTDVSEFPRETEALVAATASLFEAAEAELPAAPSRTLRLAPLPTAISAESLPQISPGFDPDRGPVRHLTGYRITWYPMDTLLGAVDFMGTWNNARNLVCGYVTWDLTDPDAPIMQDLVANYVDIKDLSKSDRAGQETVLLEANCAFGEVDQNYAALN